MADAFDPKEGASKKASRSAQRSAPKQVSKGTPPRDRAARLSAALKENLKRRKAQARLRQAADSALDGDTGNSGALGESGDT